MATSGYIYFNPVDGARLRHPMFNPVCAELGHTLIAERTTSAAAMHDRDLLASLSGDEDNTEVSLYLDAYGNLLSRPPDDWHQVPETPSPLDASPSYPPSQTGMPIDVTAVRARRGGDASQLARGVPNRQLEYYM